MRRNLNADRTREEGTVADHADEIEAVIKELKESGRYEEFASAEAEAEADAIGALLAEVHDLTDEEVDLLLASTPEGAPANAAELAAEVRRAVVRAREGEVARKEIADLGMSLRDLREERGLSITEIVSLLLERLGIAEAKSGKVEAYYRELEAERLPTARVNRRLLRVLADALGTESDDLVSPSAVILGVAGSSAVSGRRPPERSRLTSARPGSAEWDEVDELFRGGPGD
jgi:hypothetical protein